MNPLLAQSIDSAVDKGLIGVLAFIITALVGVVGWLWRERVQMEQTFRDKMEAKEKIHREEMSAKDKAHREEVGKLQAECKEEILKLSTEYRDKTEALLREQVQTVTQVVESNNKVLREAADAVKRARRGAV